jgi:hypothetical protein
MIPAIRATFMSDLLEAAAPTGRAEEVGADGGAVLCVERIVGLGSSGTVNSNLSKVIWDLPPKRSSGPFRRMIS